MPEFEIVHENIKDLPPEERQDLIWDKIIYANPIKANETLRDLDPYKPLVTYDNFAEVEKIAATRRTPAWPCGCRCPTPGPWSSCRRSSAPPRARPWP